MITTKMFLENSENYGNNGANIQIHFEKPRYDATKKKLSFKGFADSSKPEVKYKVEIAFYDVVMSYQDFLNLNWNLTKEDVLNKPIKVDCKCKAYVFNGCLKGNLANGCALYTNAELTHYEKKTDREEKNPENKPFGCKHIYSGIKQILETFNN